ncbi:2-succinyl-6-hydroxy-2,4-cyclohexadiene-1-carboxylic acid synthase/2-oxoglutarate decarboxylase [Chondrocystis sp. NIES-4102]|nr:2-succinyl-6-hydroxy-2,4-cyclohexadiene-1-carboxylic acid synthase/2-oxoglutarate decarboxylase [Chondrocystis sp. NIES-4102]
MIDFRNTNTLWASILVETLHRCGLTMAVICPGSRSTPLTLAFAAHPQITAIPILDERSAAFFALGRAKKTGLPIALICTSGTAGANFYPAAIEAKESGVPMIILTADRPAQLRNCHAGQTIDQVKLYGNIPNWQCEIALPEADLEMLNYLRQNIIQAWEQSLLPTPGVVHLNLPFREPLAPIEQPHVQLLSDQFSRKNFFIDPFSLGNNHPSSNLPWHHWQNKSGIIIAGIAQPQDPQIYCQAIANLSQRLSFPVLAEALSPIRNYANLNPYLISTYDAILRHHDYCQALIADVVIQIGELPTSKQLRNWLQQINVPRWIIAAKIDNFDPLHGKTIHLQVAVEQIVNHPDFEVKYPSQSNYCQQWCQLEAQTRNNIDNTLAQLEKIQESKAAWLLSKTLPPATSVFIANSMSVRYAEYFWKPNQRQLMPYFNRGANGIDGTLSTALGMAYGDVGVLLTGDLSLLHDTNGFLIDQQFQGHLTIVVINNSGGGIFEMLPLANIDSLATDFEKYFTTPQSVNFAQLAAAYNLEYHRIDSWQQLEGLLQNLPTQGIRILELNCARRLDAAWLKSKLNQFAKN